MRLRISRIDSLHTFSEWSPNVEFHDKEKWSKMVQLLTSIQTALWFIAVIIANILMLEIYEL